MAGRRALLLAPIGLLALQIAAWLPIRDDLEGSAWVGLISAHLGDAVPGDSSSRVPCIDVERSLWQRTRGRERRRAQDLAQRLGIRLGTWHDEVDPESPCSQVWTDVDRDTPLLARVVVGFFRYDSNADAVWMAPFAGCWWYLGSRTLWF